MDTLSTTIVNKTKVHFARFGIPRVCHTDNGPQFVGKAYKEFAKVYDFNHTSSSPYHPQGNGRAEAAVKLVKNMIKKSDDFQAALLNYTHLREVTLIPQLNGCCVVIPEQNCQPQTRFLFRE
jgi:transposase InsO family protein